MISKQNHQMSLNHLDVKYGGQNESMHFKCTANDCPYGPQGSKYFKKEIFLQNHMKNKHEEKKYTCSKCEAKFGLQSQRKYHEKYCGQTMQCSSCARNYLKPISLLMHCKRSGHRYPVEMDFKIAKKKMLNDLWNASTINANFIFVPISVPTTLIATNIPECDQNSNSSKVLSKDASSASNLVFGRNKLILPKLPDQQLPPQQQQFEHSTVDQSSNLISGPKSIIGDINNNNNNGNNSSTLSVIGKSKKVRSTDCQTVRKRHRRQSKQIESISIETQTLHSSFDLFNDNGLNPDNNVEPSSSLSRSSVDDPFTDTNILPTDNNYYRESGSRNHRQSPSLNPETTKKCSSFTQTLFDFQTNESDPFLLKSMNIDEDDDEDSQASSRKDQEPTIAKLQYQKNIETQTIGSSNCDLTSQSQHQSSPTKGNELSFSDFFEFVDIETQTIWNYDRYTQTDGSGGLFDDPQIDDEHHHRHWSSFL